MNKYFTIADGVHFEDVEFSELAGKTIVETIGNVGDNELILVCSDGIAYKMFHNQDCCEEVYLESIVGDLDDLIGHPILKAEESSSYDMNYGGDEQWTFYKLATIKGYIDIRWYGSSNGHYSVSVDFIKGFMKEIPEQGGSLCL